MSSQLNSACNCCAYPFQQNSIGVGYKEKLIKSRFCGVENAYLGPYHGIAHGTLTPSIPQNPESGELYSSLNVVYYDSGDDTVEPSEGICFDTVSGSSDFEIEADLIERVEEDYKILSNDLLRDNQSLQTCSSVCGGPKKPKLIGGGGRTYNSTNTYSSLVQGGCGADYFNYCGDCPDDIYCDGDGSNPIIVTNTDNEVYVWSVNGCREPINYPSAQGTYTRTQTSEANCCFRFVCLAQVNSSPTPNPYSNTTVQPYNIVDLPYNLNKTTATPIEPIDISDVTDAAFSKLAATAYFAPEGEDNIWSVNVLAAGGSLQDNSDSVPILLLTSSHTRYSSPFSESGFSNSAEVTLSEKEYTLAIGAPTASCYIKLWFIEEFLPQEIPEDWPTDPNGQPMPERLTSFEIEKDFSDDSEISGRCYKGPDEINFNDPINFSINPTNSTIITDSPRVLTAPTSSGTKYLKLLKFSYLKNYTPNDPYFVLDESSGEYFSTQGCKPNRTPNPTIQC